MGTASLRDFPEVVTLNEDALLRGLSDLTGRLGDLLPAGACRLVVDISGLDRLSSATLAALLRAQRLCRSRGGHVVIRGANRRCREVFARTGLSYLFYLEPAHVTEANRRVGVGESP